MITSGVVGYVTGRIPHDYTGWSLRIDHWGSTEFIQLVATSLSVVIEESVQHLPTSRSSYQGAVLIHIEPNQPDKFYQIK